MHELYEKLIEGIPAGEKIVLARRGQWRAYVENSCGGGIASLLLKGKEPYRNAVDFPSWEGRSLRDLAARICGEDCVERALACAAMTSWYNAKENLEKTGAVLYPPEEDSGNVFTVLAESCRNKIVGTVGHFHGGETLSGMKELRVFEKEPRPGDYSEQDEEALLPECEVVVITGMALTNGTMPHLLELCRDSYVALSGPSVPFSEVLFSRGVDSLFGTLVWNPEIYREIATEDTHKTTWQHMGKTVWTKV